MVAHQQVLNVDAFASGTEFREFFKAHYGPTIAAYRYNSDNPQKIAGLDADMAALGDRFLDDGVMPWEFLVMTATRRQE